MKTILFAIAMDGLDSKNADLVEQKTINALKTGSREFVDAMPVHCDYKEGLEKMCAQYLPDCLIVNEKLTGSGDIFEIIKNIKSDYPDILITVLLSESKQIGDVTLANLVASGIYNWVVQPWTPASIADSLISPKKLKDVEMYIPRFVEGSNGLAFETKYVERPVEKLDDLPDLLIDRVNNATKAKNVGDIEQDVENGASVPYKRIVNSGFGFGKSFKPIQKQVEKKEEPELPVVEEKPVGSDDNFSLKDDDTFVAAETNDTKLEETINPEPLPEKDDTVLENNESEQKQEPKKLSILEAIRELRRQQAEDNADEANKDEDETTLPPLEEPVREEPEKESIETKEEKQEETVEDNKYSALENIDLTPSEPVEENPEPEVQPVEDTKNIKQAKEEIKVKAEEPAKKEKKKPTVTLSTIEFNPKYKKILFMRAMPVSSVVPVHVCKLMNAKFVDFNKQSNNDEYFDILRTTIKEAKMPDADLIVGDVVAGNGVENLTEKFDHVIGVIPEDVYSIKAFNEKYGKLCDGIIIDKCSTSSITRKQLLTFLPNAKYIDTIKVDNCNKEVVQSAMEHVLLMNNPEFAEGMHYFLKDIGGIK